MNILVIGNGFDLAHKLPTKYLHFLEFCKRVFPIYENAEGRSINLYQQEYLFEWDFNIKIKEALEEAYVSRRNVLVEGNSSTIQTDYPRLDEMYSVIKDNIWITYFFQCDMHGKENWIDFEDEISEVIQSISKGIDENNPKNIYNNVLRLENKFFNDKFTNNVSEYLQASAEEQKKKEKPAISYKKLRDILLEDLNKLIRAFEIYLCEYVEKIEITEKSPDIETLKVDHVLSFNYTNTYENKYDNSKDIEYDYIHGRAAINNTIKSNNMVLGIDEYLGKKKQNKYVEFIAFKKFYQRIHKETGCTYKEWVDEMRQDYLFHLQKQKDAERKKYSYINDIDRSIRYFAALDIKYSECPMHNLYIFGHSLDVTDKDILRDLILNNNVYTTIFYVNKDVMGQQIANLVKVIGQKELLRRTGGRTKTIEFKLQQGMVRKENNKQKSDLNL